MKTMPIVNVVTLLLLSATVAESSGTVAGALGTSLWYSYCSPGNYTANSSYEQSLKYLFSGLPQKVSSSSTLFARDTVNSDTEVIYAVAHCRGDANASACNRCVTEALHEADVFCAFKKAAALYADLCTVRFSNETLSWRSDVENFRDRMAIKVDSSDITDLEMGVNALYTAVTRMANSSHSFVSASEKIYAYGTSYEAYALVQCVGEMTNAECGICLDHLRVSCSLAGQMVHRKATTWCSYRFELYNFFTGSPMVRLPPFTYRAHRLHYLGSPTMPVLVLEKYNEKDLLERLGHSSSACSELSFIRIRHRSEKMASCRKEASMMVTDNYTSTTISQSALSFVQPACGQASAPSAQQDRASEEDLLSAGHTQDGAPGAPEENILSAKDIVQCPSAIVCFSEITKNARGKKILIFLDYDGTISPINDIPAEATIPSDIREAVQKAAELFPTSIVSGRRIEKLKNFVKLDNVHYAGSHGQEIVMSGEPVPSYAPVGIHEQRVTHYLEDGSSKIEGAIVENNKYAVSLHFRNVDQKDWTLVEKLVEDAKAAFEGLEMTRGHMVSDLIG
ncbi:cysteine-rich receptor-like protein kinase 25 [Lolium rigidum]|uniref:cysteine-rich receptor-like protein kinase 25 n=1 Tax=Lolium rigidum TaxID=89674 RepID=UPI001F5E14D7|nr:cysteine-rich receptor-like protein kinase 25 [Lolium rigidum]